MKKLLIAAAIAAAFIMPAEAAKLGYERGQIENAGQSLAIGRLCNADRAVMDAGMFKENAAKYGRMTRYQIDIATEKVAKRFAAEMKRKPKELASWCKLERLPYSPSDELGD